MRMLDAAGHPLHTRSLSITLRQGADGAPQFAGYVLDLRKRGFAPVGGDLQGTGIIHHMQLAGALAADGTRIERIDAQMPTVAFEASAISGGESCRDLIGRVALLNGLALDDGATKRLGIEIGGPRGCSHILTLAQLLVPTVRWALAEDRRLHDSIPSRRADERIFRRDVTIDGYEPEPGEIVLTLQLNDLHLAPAPPLAKPLDRLAAQREITARAELNMRELTLRALVVRERVRTPSNLSEAVWRDRSAEIEPLLGASLRAGISARIFAAVAASPLRDALLQLAPAMIQCFAALDIWAMMPGGGPAAETGGLADSCWMWRREGALQKSRGG